MYQISPMFLISLIAVPWQKVLLSCKKKKDGNVRDTGSSVLWKIDARESRSVRMAKRFQFI